MARYKTVGLLIVFLGLFVLVNAVGHLLSFDTIARLWPVGLILSGVIMANNTGLLLSLVGLISLMNRLSVGNTSAGQALEALILAIIGLILVTGYAKHKAE